MSYVQRRANRYEFRYRLPEDLAGRPSPVNTPAALSGLISPQGGRFKREIVRSLETNDAQVANRRVIKHIAEVQATIDEARRFLRDGPATTLTSDQIEALAEQQEIRVLAGDESVRRAGIGLDFSKLSLSPDGEGMTEDDIDLYRFVVSHLDLETRERLVRMRPDESLKSRVDQLLTQRGITLVPGDPARRELEVALLAAERRALEKVGKRLTGEAIPTPQIAEFPSSPVVASGPAASNGIRLTEALKRWADGGGRGAKKPRDRTQGEAETAVRLFRELHGDMLIADITKAHARAFREATARLPKALPDKLRLLPLPKLLKEDLSGLPSRSAQTVNKTLNLLSGVLSRAEKDGHLDGHPGWTNPFRVGLEIATSERQPYEPFSADELKRFFASPVFTTGERPVGGAGEAAYWFPLIALYSGARRTEIAQLRVADVRTNPDGVAFFDFNDEGEGRNLKNASSARSVPLHPELIRLGLLTYAAQRNSKVGGGGALWAGFEAPVEAKAKAWTKWFGRYLGEHVTESRAKTFHSFRHTFKRACREAGTTEEIHHALTGHAGGGVGRSYGRERREDGSLDRGISLQRLAAETAKVTYPGLL